MFVLVLFQVFPSFSDLSLFFGSLLFLLWDFPLFLWSLSIILWFTPIYFFYGIFDSSLIPSKYISTRQVFDKEYLMSDGKVQKTIPILKQGPFVYFFVRTVLVWLCLRILSLLQFIDFDFRILSLLQSNILITSRTLLKRLKILYRKYLSSSVHYWFNFS